MLQLECLFNQLPHLDLHPIAAAAAKLLKGEMKATTRRRRKNWISCSCNSTVNLNRTVRKDCKKGEMTEKVVR